MRTLKFHLQSATMGLVVFTSIVVFLIIIPFAAHAQWMSPAFWKQHDFTLSITSTAQSNYAGDCSGGLTIQNNNWLGMAANPISPLTVNISGSSGVTFYSDTTCTQPITSVTIGTSSKNATIYYVDTSTGSPTITASVSANYYYPNPYTVSQTETVSSNPFVWTGGGADANWTTGANWSGGSAPGSGDIALFDGSCTVNCSPTVNANISVAGIRMASGYTGTITQGSGYTITLDQSYYPDDFVEMGGTFTGSAAGMTIGSNFAISGGTFNAGTQTITESYDWKVYGGTLNMTGSTLNFAAGSGGQWNVQPGTATYDNVEFTGGGSVNLNGGTITISGNVTTNSTSGWTVFGGTLDIAGNVTLTAGGGTDPWNMAVWVFDGTGTQTITSTANGAIGAVNFDSTGTISIQNPLTVTGNWNYIAGTVNLNGNGVIFTCNGNYNVSNAIAFNDLTISGGGAFIANGNPITVNGNLTITNGDPDATIDVAGNLTASGGNNDNAEGTIVLDGTGTQTITQTGGDLPSLDFNSTGTASIASALTVEGNWTYTAGTLNLNTNAVTFDYSDYSYSISPGSTAFNDVTLNVNWPHAATINSNMTIDGNLTFASGDGSVNGSTLLVAGNVTSDVRVDGTSVVELTGNASGQTLTTSAGADIPNLTINTGSDNVTLSGVVTIGGQSMYNSNGNFVVTSVGTLTTTGSTLQLEPECNGGLTLEPGTATYNNVSIVLSCSTYTMGGETMNISGNLSFGGNYGDAINSGTFAVAGNVTSSVSGLSGTAALNFTGSGTQTVSVTNSGAFPTGNISITGGGTLTLGSAVSWNGSSQATSVTSGAINMAGYDLTLASLSLNGNTLTKNGGVLTVGGTVVGTGSLYGGTVNP